MHKFKFALWLIVLLLIIATCNNNVLAQGQIKGRITEQLSSGINTGIKGVSVNAPELSRSTTTDSNGYFELSNIPKGIFKIQFSIFYKV
jgi:hypothetical protein